MYHIPYLLKQLTMGKPRFKKSHEVKGPLFEVISTYVPAVHYVGEDAGAGSIPVVLMRKTNCSSKCY